MWQCIKWIRRLVCIVGRPSQFPLETRWTHPLQGKIPYIYWGTVCRVVFSTEGDSPSHAGTGSGMPETPFPTPTCTPDTKLYLATTSKRMYPLPSPDAYTLPKSDRQNCRRDGTPFQKFYLHWYGGQPWKTVPSGHPVPPGSGPDWVRQEVRHQHRIIQPAIGPTS